MLIAIPWIPAHIGPGTAKLYAPRRLAANRDSKYSSLSLTACGNVSQLESVPMPSNDDGCWWLMSGFTAPDSGLPPRVLPSGPSSPLPPPGSRKNQKLRGQELHYGSDTAESQGSATGMRSGNGGADSGTAVIEAPDHSPVGEAREGKEGRNGSDSEGAERRGEKKRTPVRSE